MSPIASADLARSGVELGAEADQVEQLAELGGGVADAEGPAPAGRVQLQAEQVVDQREVTARARLDRADLHLEVATRQHHDRPRFALGACHAPPDGGTARNSARPVPERPARAG